jgi:hypothetical protein
LLTILHDVLKENNTLCAHWASRDRMGPVVQGKNCLEGTVYFPRLHNRLFVTSKVSEAESSVLHLSRKSWKAQAIHDDHMATRSALRRFREVIRRALEDLSFPSVRQFASAMHLQVTTVEVRLSEKCGCTACHLRRVTPISNCFQRHCTSKKTGLALCRDPG